MSLSSHVNISNFKNKIWDTNCIFDGYFTDDTTAPLPRFIISALSSTSVNMSCIDVQWGCPWSIAQCALDFPSLYCDFDLYDENVSTSERTSVNGTISLDCKRITDWSNDFKDWVKTTQPPPLEKIHIVYMTHLDLGYTDTIQRVCDWYFDALFPQAFATAKTLKDLGGQAQFSWTEFPWLIQEYLDSATGCASRPRTAKELKAMETAISEDAIKWHANALNFLTEFEDEELWNYSLQMRDKLNQRFKKEHGRMAGKLTDVTGMSMSAIPSISKNGIRAFHIGYNGVGGLPIVPGNGTIWQRGNSFGGGPAEAVFWWKHEETNTSVLLMIEDNYGSRIDGIYHRSGIVRAPNQQELGLMFYYITDNQGVPTPTQVINFWSMIGKIFPDATIVSSSLDAFVEEMLQPPLDSLFPPTKQSVAPIPIVTSELGDCWLYGGPSDPIKLATFREARRILKEAIAAGKVDPAWPQYDSYMRRLMKGPPEHNWGLSVEEWLPELQFPDERHPNFTTWPNVKFTEARSQPSYQRLENEWAAHRKWVYPLPTTFVQKHSELDSITQKKWDDFVSNDLNPMLARLHSPPEIDISKLSSIQDLAWLKKRHQCGPKNDQQNPMITVSVNPLDGSISFLGVDGTTWSNGPSNPLGAFSYMTYDMSDYKVFAEEWNNRGSDFDKPGMQTANPESKTWMPSIKAAWTNVPTNQEEQKTSFDSCVFVSLLKIDTEAHQKYGAPDELWLNITVPGSTKALADITLSWRKKTATRLPEAMWMSFVPSIPVINKINTVKWEMDVLGHPVNPLEVVRRGTRHKHAVWSGFTLIVEENTKTSTHTKELFIETLDTPLIAPGDTKHLLRFNDELPDIINGGMHSNIMNNLWGTSFPQWYDDDGLARFRLYSSSSRIENKKANISSNETLV